MAAFLAFLSNRPSITQTQVLALGQLQEEEEADVPPHDWREEEDEVCVQGLHLQAQVPPVRFGVVACALAPCPGGGHMPVPQLQEPQRRRTSWESHLPPFPRQRRWDAQQEALLQVEIFFDVGIRDDVLVLGGAASP